MSELKQSAEQWAWEQIKAGKVADFNLRFGELDPIKPEGWNEDRALGPNFMRTIFCEQPYIDQIPIEGVRIVGAFLPIGQLLPGSCNINRDILLLKCRSEQPITLSYAMFSCQCSIYSSWLGVKGEEYPSIMLYSSHFAKGLVLSSTTCERDVWLENTRVDGSLKMVGAILEGAFLADGIQVSGDLDMGENTQIKGNVCLRGARIGGALNMSGSRFEADVDGEGISVGRDLSISQQATIKGELRLKWARIDGNIETRGSSFEGGLFAFGLRVGQSLHLNKNARFKGEVTLVGAKVCADADVSDATFERKLTGIGLEVGDLMSGSAFFGGDVDLSGATIGRDFTVLGSGFAGAFEARDLRVGRQLSLAGDTTFNGVVDLGGGKIDAAVNFGENATFKGVVSLFQATIGGNFNASSNFEDGLDGFGMSVDGLFSLKGATFKGEMNLGFAKIGGTIGVGGSTFHGVFNGVGLHVGQHLDLSQKATFKSGVILNNAHVDGQVQTFGSVFESDFKGIGLQVGSDLIMGVFRPLDETDVTVAAILNQQTAYKGNVNLDYATIAGSVVTAGATFDSLVSGSRLSVGRDLLIGAGAVFKAPVLVRSASVQGDVILSGGSFLCLDLTETTITQVLRLADGTGGPSWIGIQLPGPALTLLNTQVGALQDAPSAWPSTTNLEGLSYKHFGSVETTVAAEPRNRSTGDWVTWLATDGQPNRGFSPQPYAQLADYLISTGRRDQANEVLFAGRERERREAFQSHRWPRGLWLSTLRWLCGYGIGAKTFWVLPWIFGSVALGVVVLWFGVKPAHDNGLWWCIGASVDRLLPIVELNPGFADFFDPAKFQLATGQTLSGCVMAFFSVLRLWGWVLASFLVAAVSGLVQKA